jgi:hypothetical protein
MSPVAEKQHAHELIERMAPAQVSIVVELLEDLLDPLTIRLANAPLDDEPVTKRDEAIIANSGKVKIVSTENILAEFGLTLEDFHRMSSNA